MLSRAEKGAQPGVLDHHPGKMETPLVQTSQRQGLPQLASV